MLGSELETTLTTSPAVGANALSTPFRCLVTDYKELTGSVFELKLETERAIAFEAGQYISALVPSTGPDGQTKFLKRPYSIASAPEAEVIELCIQRVERGPGSGYLGNLRPGDAFESIGPLGFLTYHAKPDRDAIFVATGTGVAPFRSILMSDKFRSQRPRSSRLLFGVRTEADLFYYQELKDIDSIVTEICLSRPKTEAADFFAGRVTDRLRALENQIQWDATEFYLCGNGSMIDEVRAYLKQHGVDRKAIHAEVYFRPDSSSLQ